MVLSIACLIAPSMQHRIVEAGQSTLRLERATSRFAAWGLLPFIASLGLTLYIVFDRVYGGLAGTAVGIASGVLAGFLWFGLAGLIGKHKRQIMTEVVAETPLSTKIEQMLTEARVIIPGCQALLGFQLIAMLTRTFDEMPFDAKLMHAAGLCCVTLATILLIYSGRRCIGIVRRQRFARIPPSRVGVRHCRFVAPCAGYRRRRLCGVLKHNRYRRSHVGGGTRLAAGDVAAVVSISNVAAPASEMNNRVHVPRGFTRRVGGALAGSSGQGCRGITPA